MALDLTGFTSEAPQFEGLYKAADTLERRKYREAQLEQEKQGRVASNTKFLAEYLNPKDRLTGTNYDPEIVKQLQKALQDGSALAAKGANTADIMMALGPQVNKINEYSTKAKLINQQIKSSIDKLKGYGGYNTAALEEEAKKTAFQDEKGGLKDISLVDPNTDYVMETTRTKPELVTTGAGLDQFVNKTPQATYSRNVQTEHLGRNKNVKVEATHPFWMDLKQDEKGKIATDNTGNPVGLDIAGGPILDDKNKPMINPETGQAYTGLHKAAFTVIMQHNPDIADYMRGQINQHFKQAGAKEIPKEGSPQWLAMGQYLLGEELKTRDKSSFKTIDKETATAPAIRMELTGSPYARPGNGAGSETPIKDTFNDIDKLATEKKNEGGAYLQVNLLPVDAQSVVIDFARKLTGNTDLGQKDIYIQKDDNGRVGIYNSKKKQLIGYMDKTNINLKSQPGIKEKREVLKQGEGKTYQYKGKTYTEDHLRAAATKSGMTLEEYKKELGL